MHGKFASFLRGIYFTRFPLSLWSILLLLGPLDRWTGAASFTRGILAPESGPQAATASFMVISVGMIILLLVRIIAVNGDEQFETAYADTDGKLVTMQTSWLRRNTEYPPKGLYRFPTVPPVLICAATHGNLVDRPLCLSFPMWLVLLFRRR
jgi:hypothetical protein